jgi:anti-anti-sigma factor
MKSTITPTTNVLRLSGVFDRSQIHQFNQSIHDLINTGAGQILLDFQDVIFMDSSGLGALVGALKSVEAVGSKLLLCSLKSEVRMLLELTDIDQFFVIFPNSESVA